MDVLVTGIGGTVGGALVDHSTYDFAGLDREPGQNVDHVADVTEYDAVREAVEDQDAVVHLAGDARVSAGWQSVLQNNVVGTRTVLRAAADAGVESVVFASSNHVVGGYEDEFAPELYDPDFELTVDHESPIRPDSDYGTSKVYGEAAGRQYVEQHDYPKRFYALRIASVRPPAYDHPYGDAERGVDQGRWERGSEAYERSVARLHATWQSRRDIANLVDGCLRDDSVAFDVFYGVSDNRASWFDIEHARKVVGYDPHDSADEWEARPQEE
ncbi:NAD-dependent epimerase/dehydratase family protein [Halorarius litoreus]|uniref:NAD-dependent epimerase/dehydratase family protein n=1 Tax=Halorarius litoreus TaxID=2962676 RepID=UPI0020CC4F0C|nr:NAD-dependent epimerase/dehydratase family protein [Halorarius litoreus]